MEKLFKKKFRLMYSKTSLNDKEHDMKPKNQSSNNEEVNLNSTVDPIKLDEKESNQLLNDEKSNQLLNDEKLNQLLNNEKFIRSMSLKDPKCELNYQSNQNLTTKSIKLDNELKFKLNLNIRDKLIEILNDYTSLFYGGDKNKEKIIEKANDLMHNFVDLPLKTDQIKENVINQIETLKPTLIINSKMKTEITDLLIKNKNYFILFKDDKDVISNLIDENNNLVIKLIQFPIEMLKEDDPINNDYVWKRVLIKESNYTVDDLLMAKSEFDKEVVNYKKELLELKEKISKSNALSTNKIESVTRFFEIESFHAFYKQDSGKINTLPFECSGLEFMINIQNSSKYFYFELVLLNKLDSNKVKATCELILINNKQYMYKENITFNLDQVFTQNQLFQSKEKIYKDSLFYNTFVYYNALKMKVNLTAELTKLVD